MSLENKFLAGKTVLTLRDPKQNSELCEKVCEHGGIVMNIPLISFKEPKALTKQTSLALLREINSFDWLVLTSKNGVAFTFRLLNELEMILSPSTKIAAIGSKTAEHLQKLEKTVDFIPSSFVAEIFLSEFLNVVSRDEKVLVCKGNLARDVIATGLITEGITVREAIVYENALPSGAEAALVDAFTKGKIDYIILTSPSTVDHLMEIASKHQLLDIVKECLLVSIGPITTKRTTWHGLPVHLTAEEFTAAGIISELVKGEERYGI